MGVECDDLLGLRHLLGHLVLCVAVVTWTLSMRQSQRHVILAVRVRVRVRVRVIIRVRVRVRVIVRVGVRVRVWVRVRVRVMVRHVLVRYSSRPITEIMRYGLRVQRIISMDVAHRPHILHCSLRPSGFMDVDLRPRTLQTSYLIVFTDRLQYARLIRPLHKSSTSHAPSHGRKSFGAGGD